MQNKSGGMMYKTMYGGISQNNLTSKQPIHIKIEDQITNPNMSHVQH